jgi:hypothetical protein
VGSDGGFCGFWSLGKWEVPINHVKTHKGWAVGQLGQEQHNN